MKMHPIPSPREEDIKLATGGQRVPPCNVSANGTPARAAGPTPAALTKESVASSQLGGMLAVISEQGRDSLPFTATDRLELNLLGIRGAHTNDMLVVLKLLGERCILTRIAARFPLHRIGRPGRSNLFELRQHRQHRLRSCRAPQGSGANPYEWL
jgi:hypothetical protein